MLTRSHARTHKCVKANLCRRTGRTGCYQVPLQKYEPWQPADARAHAGTTRAHTLVAKFYLMSILKTSSWRTSSCHWSRVAVALPDNRWRLRVSVAHEGRRVLPLKVQRPVACCTNAAATVECKANVCSGSFGGAPVETPPRKKTHRREGGALQLYC